MSTLNFPLNYTYVVKPFDTATTLPDGLSSLNRFYQYGSKYIMPLFDTSNVTDMSYMFYYSQSLVAVPLFDTSNVTDMSNMFYYCSALLTVPLFDTSSVTNMSYMLYNTVKLTEIPQFDTSNVTNMNYMFYNSGVTTIPELDCSSVTTIQNFCTGSTNNKNLINVGGFKNLGMQSTLLSGTNFMNYSQYLTHESMLNIVNGLYDRASAGYSTVTLKFHANALAKLSDEEKAIATNKGWILS